jgi:hypothetical protein
VNEDDEPKHMARELADGVWGSKMGDAQDIHHHSLEGIEGDRYGKAEYFMRRPLQEVEKGATDEQPAEEQEASTK